MHSALREDPPVSLPWRVPSKYPVFVPGNPPGAVTVLTLSVSSRCTVNFIYIVCADNRLKRIFFHNITPDSSKKKEMRCHCVSLGGSWCAGGGAESDLEAVLPALPTTFLHTDTPFLLLCPCLYRLKFFYIFLSMICSPLPPSSCLFLRNSNTFGRPPADDR